MKSCFVSSATVLLGVGLLAFACQAQEVPNTQVVAVPAAARAKSDAEVEKRAGEWASALGLEDKEKQSRVQQLVATHLKAVRDWHNEHPYTTVPPGMNPTTEKPLSNLDRQMIADSAIPKSVHDALMTGLRGELTPPQVEVILDKYTVGKVAFTLAGYKAIVPDLTAEEEAVIVDLLKQAREQAIDYKAMNQISAVFEIYKTRCEQHLNANGRNWKELYRAYTAAQKAKKAAAKTGAQP